MAPGRSNRVTLSRDRVEFDGRTIEYEVRRSVRRRKTVEIALDRGNVRVLAPSNLPADDVRRIVCKRAAWILKRLADSLVAPSMRRFVSGDTLPYLGQNIKMVVQGADVPVPEVHLERQQLLVSVPYCIEEPERVEHIGNAIVGWFKGRASELLPMKVDLWRPRLGIEARPRILVRNQRSQWGSCSSGGTIRFSWRVMMLEPPLMEYIVVHELAHLKVMDHSAAFWKVVSDVMPDAKDRRRRLGVVGRTLPM